ncbi:hypothetical protein FH972_026140 [Carpinus fangiana]|uniref:Non-structural maintenance of chromosomes element 4 n=1 Tax=Carpinus fangiana TaxID=176857 RepID=A0A5N6L329_9ROSI|nr:hypothetical protein FH972_026140 [Carpinus fangiana]
MARLRVTESAVSDTNTLYRDPSTTPSPSQSSDKENDNSAASTKAGPTRRSTSSMPLGDQSPRSAKRRRLADRDGAPRMTTPEQEQDEEDSSSDHDATPTQPANPRSQYYDPNQSMAERHVLRKGLRELNNEANDNRQEWIQPGNDALLKAISRSDSMYKDVKQTSDATIDSRFLVTAGDLAYRKTNQMVVGDSSQGIDVDEFMGKAISWMRKGGPTTPARTADAEDDDDDDDDDGDALDWAKLGRACFRFTRRPALPSFLLGPLAVQKRTRQPTQRRAANAASQRNLVETRPEVMDNAQLGKSEATTSAMSLRIHRLIRRTTADVGRRINADAESGMAEAEIEAWLVREGMSCEGMVPFFRLVVNPHSFGQTVENMFWFSFLIKDGWYGLDIDKDGVLCVVPARAGTAEDDDDAETPREQDTHERYQSIFDIDHDVWRDIVKEFHLTKPLIPDRAAEERAAMQITANGWYA